MNRVHPVLVRSSRLNLNRVNPATNGPSKGRKHYMALGFDDGGQQVAALEFRPYKNKQLSKHGVLRTVEQITNLTTQGSCSGSSGLIGR